MPTTLAADTLNQEFLTILMFLLFGAGFVVLNMVAVGRLIRSRAKYTAQKSTPYECGEPTFGSAFVRFDIRFYVLALVFVIFDVETVFLFPWAAVLRELGPVAFVEAVMFIAVLALGLAYVWRKGDVEWTPQHTHKLHHERLRRAVDEAASHEAPASEPLVTANAGAAAEGGRVQ
ncbi:MAG: NAD(P)H-quinone oxidoreductase subunit 3, chloroplastic [Planctomycetes bacterium]|nr:NAD(P)H-quinone oxidoreductase subunit 3, chloroplastic [Planctomycetota bacterium]